ncbi:MAG: hypothetical protein ACK559_03145, partial [bacterium]
VAISSTVWATAIARSARKTQVKLREELALCKRSLENYEKIYKPIIDINREVESQKTALQKLQENRDRIEAEISSAKSGLARITQELALANDAAFLIEVGYYQPRYE